MYNLTFKVMITKITEGIKISVQTSYQESNSNPLKSHFFFTYKISIENQNDYAIRLLKRHWHIFDSSGEYSEVEGDGVVGQQPLIEPGEIYTYDSACNLSTDIGKMYGTYLMEKIIDGTRFDVHIPEFELVEPSRLN